MSELEKRLERFVRYFVEKFESYFADAHARLIERRPKAGKWVDFFEELVGISKSAGETLEGAPKALALIALDLLVKGVKIKTTADNWDKLKKFGHKLLEYGVDNPLVRNGLIEGAVHIFAKFEAQFMNVTTDAGWEYAMSKIAEDAVNRVISYLKNSDLMIDEKAISKCLISGESKKYCNAKGFPNFHRGHTIKLLGVNITTKQLFTNLGVKINEEYHVPNITKRQIPFDEGAWFRHQFEWESNSTTEMDKLHRAPPNPYTYVLVGQELDDKLEAIKSIIEKERPNQVNKEVLQAFDNLALELLTLIEATEKIQEIATQTLETVHVVDTKVDDIKEITLAIRDKLNRDEETPKLENPIWSVPKKLVPSFTGRKTELDDLHERVLRETSTGLSLVTVLSGLGGIGKTQLALKYAHKYREMFFDVVWLDAENEGSLSKSFVTLAREECGKQTTDTNGKEMQTPAIVKMVYNYFRERKSTKNSLFIFDNTEKSYDLVEFLPNYDDSSITDHSCGKIRSLITSREQEWFIRYPDVKVLPLHEFSLQDAVDFVKSSLKSDNDQGIGELVTALQHYPLALEQAVAYIIDERVTNLDYSVTNYLVDYKKKAKELLNDEVFQKTWKAYKKTTYTTWTLTMNKISSVGPHGQLAVKLMNLIALMSPNDIHREIFFRLEGVNESDVRQAVRLVVNHSMLNGEEGQKVISVHRLVQEVTRLHMNQDDLENYLDIALALMGCWLTNISEQQLEEVSRIFKMTLAHLETLTDHLGSNNQNGTENWKLSKTLAWLGQGYHFTYDRRKLENVLMKEMEIDRTLKLYNPRRKATLLENLADVRNELGKYPEAITALKQALSVNEEIGDQTMMAESHSKLADVYKATWDLERSREHYHKALEILDNHAKGNDRHVVINKLSICLSLRLVDDTTTLALLQKNLRYWEENSGDYDYLFSPKQLLDLAEAYMITGNNENERKYINDSLEMCENVGHDILYARMICMINDYNVQRNLELQLENPLKKSLEILKETQGAQHIETIKCMVNFAQFYFKQGNMKNGFQLMEDALDIAKQCNNNEVQGEVLVRLGLKYHEIGDHEKALKFAMDGLSVLEVCYGKSSIKLYSALEVLAFIHESNGSTEQQRDICQRLLLIAQEQSREGDYKLARAQVKYGRTLKLLGDKEKSKELVEKGMATLQSQYGTRELAELAVTTPLTAFIN